jgi:plastocyanin
MNRRALCALAGALLLPAWAGAADHVVTIEGMQFHPATVTVRAGDRITWRNQDVVPHTVTAAGRFDSGSVAGGKTWSWTARTRGRHDYVCTFHPGMKGTVIVE